MTQPSTYEVGWSDNGPEKLPGSVQGTAIRGDSAYGTNEYAKPTPLDAKTSAGVIGTPTIAASYGLPNVSASVDVHNSSTSLNTTNSEENRSAKFKHPNVSQDYPAKDGPTQYNDHN